MVGSLCTQYDEMSLLSVPYHKNIEENQSVFGSSLCVSFSTNQFAGPYFTIFFFAGFYCIGCPRGRH